MQSWDTGCLGAAPRLARPARAAGCVLAFLPFGSHFSGCLRDEPLGLGRGGGISSVLAPSGPALRPAFLARTGRVFERARTTSVTTLARLASQSRVGRCCLRPVLKHGPRSLACVQVNGQTKPSGAVKAKGAFGHLRGDPAAIRRRNPGASHRPRFVRSSQSTHAGTRKMVNYAWPG